MGESSNSPSASRLLLLFPAMTAIEVVDGCVVPHTGTMFSAVVVADVTSTWKHDGVDVTVLVVVVENLVTVEVSTKE